jgi:hypothetical protein
MLNTIPWLLAVATAVWFGWMARSYQRNWVPWVVAGGLFALVSTTLVLGLAQAALIPLSHELEVAFRIKSVVAALVIIVIVGGIVAWRLQAAEDAKIPTSAATAPPQP